MTCLGMHYENKTSNKRLAQAQVHAIGRAQVHAMAHAQVQVQYNVRGCNSLVTYAATHVSRSFRSGASKATGMRASWHTLRTTPQNQRAQGQDQPLKM